MIDFKVSVPENSSACVFLGSRSGTFVAQDGRLIPFATAWLGSPVTAISNDTTSRVQGLSVDKAKLLSADLLAGIEPGDLVLPFYDKNQRVIKLELIDG